MSRGPSALPAAAAFAAATLPAHAQTEIQWWHLDDRRPERLGGRPGQRLQRQPEGTRSCRPTRGSYDESMTAAIAAFRAGNAPHVLQVFEVGTATMMASKGAIVPVGEVMKTPATKFDPWPTSGGGRLLHGAERADAQLPAEQLDHRAQLQQGTCSRPALDPNKPPATWPELVAAAKLKASGDNLPVHHQLAGLDAAGELSTWHNTLFATQGNGFGGTRRAAGRSTARCTCAHREPGQHGQAGPVPVPRPRRPRRRPSTRASARWHRPRRRPTRASRRTPSSSSASPALLPRRARHAAEHRDRRRLAGDVGQRRRPTTRAWRPSSTT